MEASNTQKVIKGISSQTLVTLLVGVVEIVSFSIMSRLLTQEDFGYYAAITAITTVFASFSETGIGAALIQRQSINKRYIDNAFTLSLLFGCFISVILIILAKPLSTTVIDQSLRIPLMLMSVTLLCNCLSSVSISLLQRNLRFLSVGLINLLSQIITTVVAVVLAIKGFGYYAILTKAILQSFLVLVFSFYATHLKFSLALDKGMVATIFGFSGWLMASVFFRNFAQQIDRLLMGRLLSVSALGEYNRPKEFINQVSSKLNGIFDTALFPVLSGIQDKKDSMANAYILSFYYMNLFAMLLTLLFVFNHELIIRVFLGEQWMNTRILFVILSLALVFNIDGRLSDCYFRSLGLTKQQFHFRVLELIIKSIAIIIGAKWHLIGVSVSVVIANFVMIVLKTFYVSKRVGVFPKRLFSVIVESWKFTLFEIPILLFAFFTLPHSWLGNVALLFVYFCCNGLLFFFLPGFVGVRYKEGAYAQIVFKAKRFLHL